MWALSSELPHELRRICVNIPSIPLSVDTTLTHTHAYSGYTHTDTLPALSPPEPRGPACRYDPADRAKFGKVKFLRVETDAGFMKSSAENPDIFRGGHCQRIFT